MITRYWHTLRYLKFSQFYNRLKFRIFKQKPNATKNLSNREPLNQFISPAKRQISLLGPTEFHLLNKSGKLEDIGWNGTQKNKLWRYNQHYFDDLNANQNYLRSKWHKNLVNRWIDENPLYSGVGWEPYPTSLRIVNWIKFFLRGFQPSRPQLDSLATQANFLYHRLEYHLLGNHLLANAKALYFAGCYFKGSNSEKWLKTALNIFKVQLPEQILKDGGHFELSPMYHALILEDLLDLTNIARTYGYTSDLKKWEMYIAQMFKWLKGMSHPDGRLSFFNDTAFGVAPKNAELFIYAKKLGFQNVDEDIKSHIFSESGYVRIVNTKLILICDIAKVGPDYLPGHAHADTLSCELSLFGHRVFVNSGTSQYGDNTERHRQRSTAAHNTVEINGKNSSEVWSGFRVARRAYPIGIKYTKSEEQFKLCASHTGYRRLKGGATHRRTWETNNSSVKIVDRIDGHYKQAIGFWHLHPDVKVSLVDPSTYELFVQSGKSAIVKIKGATHELKKSIWHPEFGKSIINSCIVFNFESSTVITLVQWDNN